MRTSNRILRGGSALTEAEVAWGIQTVYIPRENLRFIEEWIQYHLILGAEYFYLYDNTGSASLDAGNSIAVNGKNKYGIPVDFSLSDKEVEEIEAEIFKKYPVKKVKWQPMEGGKIIYGQLAACDHFAETTSVDWCAFIDIDEFLCSPHPISEILQGSAVTIYQKKFEDRFHYDTALQITKTFSINTEKWAPKSIIKMKDYVIGAKSIHNLPSRNLPTCLSMDILRFNHYNYNRSQHEWLWRNYRHLDKNWRPRGFPWPWRANAFQEVFTENCDLLKEISKKIDYSKFMNVFRA